MRIVITGGGGFLGSRLAFRILERGQLTNASGEMSTITELVLFDVVPPRVMDPRLRHVCRRVSSIESRP